MAAEQPFSANNGSQKSAVALTFPSGREFVWVSQDSPIADWRVGQAVFFRNSHWRVLGRREHPNVLSLTLAPSDGPD